MMKNKTQPHGFDLVAVNIQRGRDHGLPGYNQYRRLCGLQPANSFNDLNRFMTAGAAETFSQMYQNVEDIDLFIGGVHEDPLPDALVGPTFACIVAEQFRRSKFGDRFWYENGQMKHSFNDGKFLFHYYSHVFFIHLLILNRKIQSTFCQCKTQRNYQLFQ